MAEHCITTRRAVLSGIAVLPLAALSATPTRAAPAISLPEAIAALQLHFGDLVQPGNGWNLQVGRAPEGEIYCEVHEVILGPKALSGQHQRRWEKLLTEELI